MENIFFIEVIQLNLEFPGQIGVKLKMTASKFHDFFIPISCQYLNGMYYK